MITSGLVLLLLVVITVASLSPIPMITEVHITTLLSTFSPAEPKSCEDNCDIAYQYLIGQQEEELPFFYKDLSEGALLDMICAQDSKCAGCDYWHVVKGVKEISEGLNE